MSVSDKILAKALKNALSANRMAKELAEKSSRSVHQDSTNVKVCSAHVSMVELLEAQLGYLKALGEGVEVIMESAIAVLDERATRRSYMSLLATANVLVLIVSVIAQYLTLWGG